MKWRENKAAISASLGVHAGSSHYVIGLKMAYGHKVIVKGAQTSIWRVYSAPMFRKICLLAAFHTPNA